MPADWKVVTRNNPGYEKRSPDTGGSGGNSTQPAVPQFLTNGGSLGLGVGLSILIPLLCAVVLQCKKSRAERRRQVAATASRDPGQTTPPQPSAAAGSLDLPPPYETLFPSLPPGDAPPSPHSAPSSSAPHTATVDMEASNSDPAPSRSLLGAWRPPANQGPLLGTSGSVDSQTSTGLFTITLPVGNSTSGSQNEGSGGNGVSSGLVDSHPGVLCPRRFPGMHLALHELWAPVMGDDVTPPPSYADALKMINMIFEDKASSGNA